MRDKILVIGSLNYDIILKQKRLPEAGETYAVDRAVFCGGGKGANQAVQAAKLGAQVYMAGAVGNDAMGSYLRQNLLEYGVRDKYLKTVEGESGVGIVNCLEDGTVFANIVRGANHRITKADIDNLEEIMTQTKVMILQLEIPVPIVEYIIEKAVQKGIRILLNAAPAVKIAEKSLKQCDSIIVNEVESSYYCNKKINSVEQAEAAILDFSRQYGVKSVFTLGKDGAVVCDGSGVKQIPACRVNAVETTGAGDSFVGALGYCLLKDMDLFEAAKFASCCSAITVCGIGAQPSMPVLDEVQSFRENMIR